MKVVEPYKHIATDTYNNSIEYLNTIVSTTLTNDSSIPEYDSATSYAVGDKVTLSSLHRVYQCVVACTGEYPFNNVNWVDIGAVNSYACFDLQLNTTAKFTSNTTITLDISRATTLALIGLKNVYEINITITDLNTSTSITEVISMRDYGVYSIFDYAYKPIREKTQLIKNIEWYPSSTVTIVLKPLIGTTAEVGMIITGTKEDTGVALYKSSTGFTDFSKVVTDDWGNTNFVKRNTANVVDAKLSIYTSNIDEVINTFKRLRASINLFIGDERDNGFESMTIVGFVKDLSVPIDPVVSQFNIKIIGVI